ncbi:MAG: dihydropteroate synthase [Deltaproteobacteria bacterium]|nr:dihydropteroate synthase [Deltaproteobacteria bacterium]
MVIRKKYQLDWGKHRLRLGDKTLIMGVINVTPDSFSDGGLFFGPDQAIGQGEALAAQGADLIDVGGESTRPFSEPLPTREERERVIPVIRELARRLAIPISVDTYKAEVARAALENGAALINDISALRFDPEMAAVAQSFQVPVILMHMQGTPRNMQTQPRYQDLLGELHSFFEERLSWCRANGIPPERLLLDPGIGFGKTLLHNLTLIKRLDFFKDLDCPLLIGTSRKSFIGRLTGQENPREREWGTGATTALAAWQGAHIVRVHEVAAARQILAVTDALREAPGA